MLEAQEPDRGFSVDARGQEFKPRPLVTIVAEMERIHGEHQLVKLYPEFGHGEFLGGVLGGIRDSFVDLGKSGDIFLMQPNAELLSALEDAKAKLAFPKEGDKSMDYAAGRVAALEWVMGLRANLDTPSTKPTPENAGDMALKHVR